MQSSFNRNLDRKGRMRRSSTCRSRKRMEKMTHRGNSCVASSSTMTSLLSSHSPHHRFVAPPPFPPSCGCALCTARERPLGKLRFVVLLLSHNRFHGALARVPTLLPPFARVPSSRTISAGVNPISCPKIYPQKRRMAPKTKNLIKTPPHKRYSTL